MFELEQKVKVKKDGYEGKIIRRKVDNCKTMYQLDNEKWYEENEVEIRDSYTLKRALDYFLNNGITEEVITVELNKIIISIYDDGYKATLEHNRTRYNLLNPRTPLKYREILKKYKECNQDYDDFKYNKLIKYIFKEIEEVKEIILCIDGDIIHKYKPKDKEEGEE